MSTSHSSRNHHDPDPASPSSNPVHVPRPESPQPIPSSVDGGADDLGAQRMSDPSYLLPRRPEHAQVSPPMTARDSSYHPDGPASVTRPDFQRQNTAATRRQSELDWIIPVEAKTEHRPRTVQERLAPTLEHAKSERIKCELKARLTGYALNAAIGMQVLLGALTTGVAAATTGRSTSIATSVLGGMTTLVASYLARARGSNEPELSITRVKDLDQFVRECEILMMDYGTVTGTEHDPALTKLRERFEELLGNGNGERRLASV